MNHNLPIGEMYLEEVIEILKEIEDFEALIEIERALKEYSFEYGIDFNDISSIKEKFSECKLTNKVYKHTSYEVGYISPQKNDGSIEEIQLKNAKSIKPNLKNKTTTAQQVE